VYSKTDIENEIKKGGGSVNILTLISRWLAGGRGATQPPNIYNIFFM
tara:strand:+ start:142 stop:282 length:141 start_codon:yes stop_codon:yes gene_type:complete